MSKPADLYQLASAAVALGSAGVSAAHASYSLRGLIDRATLDEDIAILRRRAVEASEIFGPEYTRVRPDHDATARESTPPVRRSIALGGVK